MFYFLRLEKHVDKALFLFCSICNAIVPLFESYTQYDPSKNEETSHIKDK